MLPSLRNSEEGHLFPLRHIVQEISLQQRYWTPSGIPQKVSERPQNLRHSEYDHIIDPKSSTDHYFGHYSEAEDGQVIVLHTSGSTGLPKPIYLANGGLATISVMKVMPAPQGQINAHDALLTSDQPLFTMLLFFHAMGLISILQSIFCCGPLILPLSGQPMNAGLVIKCAKQTKPGVDFCALYAGGAE